MILSKYPEVHDCPAAVLNLKLQHETAVYVTVRKRLLLFWMEFFVIPIYGEGYGYYSMSKSAVT